ncbi:MAG: TIGR03088 family PEP-CTERM/XrtA system glycosyltransferase [Halorhodospira sp.]
MTLGDDLQSARDGQGACPLIAHILYRLDVGGLENILVELIRGSIDHGFRHAVVCLADYDEAFRRRLPGEVPVHALHKPPGWGLGVQWRLYRLLRELRPDVVHTSNLAALECQPVAALSGVPARVHAEHGWDMADLDGTRRRYRWLRRALSPWVHRHVTVSQHLADYLVQRARIPKYRVHQIYNGVDTERYRPVTPSPREGRRQGQPLVIGTVGRLTAVKDQATLIRAVARLRDRVSPGRGGLRLVVIGSGPQEQPLRTLAADLGVADVVELTGSCSDVAARLGEFDVFALPSLAEGIPVTVLEAMASGLPVVASRVGGIPELVEEGVNGTLVPAGDAEQLCEALAGYLADPRRGMIEGAEGRRRAVELFSVEAMVTAYEALYRELLWASARGTAVARKG